MTTLLVTRRRHIYLPYISHDARFDGVRRDRSFDEFRRQVERDFAIESPASPPGGTGP